MVIYPGPLMLNPRVNAERISSGAPLQQGATSTADTRRTLQMQTQTKHMPILEVRIVFISVSNLKAVFLLSCAFKRFMFPSSTFTPLLTPSCPPTSYNKPVAPTPLAPQASQSPEQRWMSRGFMTSDLAALKLSLDQVTTHSFQLLTSLICNKYNCVCSIGLIICLGS